jgi:hypothetical protein
MRPIIPCGLPAAGLLIAMLRESHFSIGENNLYLETDNIKTVIFDKRE